MSRLILGSYNKSINQTAGLRVGIIAGALIIGGAIGAAQFVNRYRLASGVSC